MPNPLNRFVGSLRRAKALPLVLFVVLPVLAIRVHYLTVAPDAAPHWPGVYLGDTRSWWKAVFVVGLGLAMLCHALALLATGWRPRFPAFGLMLTAAACATLVSSFASPYPATAWLGMTTLYEGAPTLLAYLAAAWYAAEAIDTEAERLLVVRVIGCVGLVNGLHGVLEGLGWHFWRTSAGRWLMGAGDAEVRFNFADSNLAYGTLFQPNHYGMFMAMIAVLGLGMVFCEKKTGWKAFWITTVSFCLLGVIFSYSRAAAGVCVAVGVACVLLRLAKGLKSGTDCQSIRRGRVVPVLIAVVLVPALFLVFSDTARDTSLALAGRLLGTFSPAENHPVSFVGLDNNAIRIHHHGRVISLFRENTSTWTSSRDDAPQQQEPIALLPAADGWSAAPLPGIEGGVLRTRADGNVLLQVDGVALRFFHTGNDLIALDNKNHPHQTLAPPRAVPLGGLERYLGGRGYIWPRALPVIPDHPWFGSGPGSFAMVFANDDPVGKQRFLENVDEDKGHGVWITFLVQLGLVGLLAYCVPVAYVLRRALRRPTGLSSALAMGLTAYLLAVITNDSTVGVTPVFCVLAGLALSRSGDVATGCDAKKADSNAPQGKPQ